MNLQRMGALGAQGAAAGAMVAWLGFVYATRPVTSGGIDPVLHLCLSAAAFVPCALIAAVDAWFGAQLKRGPVMIRG